MKRIVLPMIIFASALVLGSCSSTNKLASSAKSDDVYYAEAKAGEAPAYVAPTAPQEQYDEDDYYYYDDYASRINRFGYFSPFGFYNDLYYGYGGFGLGFGYGWGGFGSGWGSGYYGYSPFGYGYYGYSPFGYGYGYGGYPYYGIAYGGYGYPYWGGYIGGLPYRTGAGARPYTGPGIPARGFANGLTRTGYRGFSSSFAGRPGNYGIARPYGSRGNAIRPTRPANTSYRPSEQSQGRTSVSPSNSGGGYSGGGSGGGRSNGGARGGRP